MPFAVARTRRPRLLVFTFGFLLALVWWATAPRPARGETLDADAPRTATANDVVARGRLRAGDEFWLLDTRSLGGGADEQVARSMSVHQRLDADDASRWRTRSLDDFLRVDADVATIFYAHGNRVTPDGAVEGGWRLYRRLAVGDAPRLRLVVWSWPSEQMRGPLRDVRSKASRSNDDAYYFGWVLRRYPSPRPIGLYGYSFGARIVTGGLHLAAGGSLGGATLAAPADAPTNAPPPRYGVVLVAAAEHDGWIMPAGLHGRALESVDRLLNLYNSCDPALARYRMIDRCERPSALGYLGLHPDSLGVYASKVEQRDAASSVGGTHDEGAYVGRGLSDEDLRRHLLLPNAASR